MTKNETFYTVERLDLDSNKYYEIKKFKKDYYGAYTYTMDDTEIGSYRIQMYKYNIDKKRYDVETIRMIEKKGAKEIYVKNTEHKD